jgi:MFS family permease
MPAGFAYLIAAQFFSALADNALLIVGIFTLQAQGHPDWWAPLLKFFFNASYVVLAPLLGPLADAMPKARLMAGMNAVKLGGVVVLLAGLHPALAFALVGLAASAYAPAKYGLVTESVPARWLVRANAWLEVSVVLSVILGIALGGALVALCTHPATALALPWLARWGAGSQALPALLCVSLLYVLAAVLNAGIRPGHWAPALQPLRWRQLAWTHFWRGNRRLWQDPLGGLSLYVTTLYWGTGAVIQFAVLVWAQRSLDLPLSQGAYLQALVAVGVIGGAALAGRWYKLHAARQVLPVGLLLPTLLPVIALTHELWLALPLMLLVGAAGGVLLVPMNALLQHRGRRVLNTGQSIAVQGFNENLSVLLMLGLYSGFLALDLPIWAIMLAFSLLLAGGMLPLLLRKTRSAIR